MSDTPRILRFACIDSTNTEARGRALSGERGPLWLCADRQTAGRGRRGREWTSVDGNLFTTGLYTLEHTPGQAAELSFAAALSVAEVCDSVLDDRERTKLKWPNDVLVDRKKVAGLLLESGDAPGGGLWLAIGVGLNLVSHPDDAERPATDLSEAGGGLDRDAALDRLIAAFETWRRRWLDFGFAPIRDAWLARAHGLGEACEARLQGETVKGVFADLAQDGALRLDLAGGGRRYISAGEVFFPDRG